MSAQKNTNIYRINHELYKMTSVSFSKLVGYQSRHYYKILNGHSKQPVILPIIVSQLISEYAQPTFYKEVLPKISDVYPVTTTNELAELRVKYMDLTISKMAEKMKLSASTYSKMEKRSKADIPMRFINVLSHIIGQSEIERRECCPYPMKVIHDMIKWNPAHLINNSQLAYLKKVRQADMSFRKTLGKYGGTLWDGNKLTAAYVKHMKLSPLAVWYVDDINRWEPNRLSNTPNQMNKPQSKEDRLILRRIEEKYSPSKYLDEMARFDEEMRLLELNGDATTLDPSKLIMPEPLSDKTTNPAMDANLEDDWAALMGGG